VTGASALARVSLGRFGSVRLAVNQRRESLDSSGVIRDVPVGGSSGGGGGRGGGSQPPRFDVRSFVLDRHVDVYSTGAEWQAQPVARLGTVIGVAANIQQRPAGVTEKAPTWLAGVSFAATGDLRLHASAARKIRVPSIDQLFNASAGNPALRAERANEIDAGADYRLGSSTTIGVSAFSTHARDFIERTSPMPFQNQDRYRFRGAELTGHTTAISRLELRGSYSFLDSEEVTMSGTAPLQTRPRHRAAVEWIWTPLARSTLRGSIYGVGAQIYDSRGAVPVQREFDGFTLVDVGFTRTLARRFEVAFDVSNLFDQLYDQSYALPREGRAAVLTLKVRPD
jgi:outer membrane receptor protein involved in Fe transport